MQNLKSRVYSSSMQTAHNGVIASVISVASVTQIMDPTDSLLIAVFNIRFEIGKQIRS